jgi:hypothetical protein
MSATASSWKQWKHKLKAALCLAQGGKDSHATNQGHGSELQQANKSADHDDPQQQQQQQQYPAAAAADGGLSRPRECPLACAEGLCM